MKDQTRNLHPTKEAIIAMWHWHTEYAAQKGGSMDFWDSLSRQQKDYCRMLLEKLKI